MTTDQQSANDNFIVAQNMFAQAVVLYCTKGTTLTAEDAFQIKNDLAASLCHFEVAVDQLRGE